MATSLPWSIKGVDSRTRDAAKAAARRAGMTLGEWLEHTVRTESGDDQNASPPPEQLDIAALSERLSRLSQGQMESSPQAAASAAPKAAALSRDQIDAALSQAASAERLTRESSAQTVGALDSIARWIEKTENRMTAGERAAAERQERATAVIADAIKSMGERIVEMERRASEPPRAPAQPPRLAFSRENFADAVSDIRTRQRALDKDRDQRPTARPAVPESRIAALRQDLRDLSDRIAPAQHQPDPARLRAAMAGRDRVAPPGDPNPIEAMLADLGARLDRLDRGDRLEPVMKPLARIESEVARLAQDRSGESYQRFELEVAHLAAKVDALAARGGDRAVLAPVLRDVAELRDMVSASAGDPRLDDLSRQIAGLSSDVARLRDQQPDGRELRNLSLTIEDVRDAIMADRGRDRHADPAALIALSRQVETLAGRIEALPAMRPDAISDQAEQLMARLSAAEASGRGVSDGLAQRIETLVGALEDMASRQPGQIESRIDGLQQRIEMLAEQGPAAVTRQIEALAGRIESLAASSNLTQLVNEGKSVQVARVDLRPIEDMLRGLADKIDEAGRPGAETDAFDALEQQISGLAQRLDTAAATRSAETGIERTLQDLVVHLQTVRHDAAETAERAARAAVSDMAGRVAPGNGLAELSSLVTGLRETHVSSGRETQDALGAVHQTLETVISRLASIEADLAGERKMPAAMQAKPAMPPARPLDPATAVSVTPDDRVLAERAPQAESPALASLDLPLEPGSGRPRPAAAALQGNDPQSIRQNLIAAARRSAKAATEAAAAAPDAAAATPAKSGGRLKEIMEKRRRPILLGLAAIVLAMGTAQVVNTAIQSRTKSVSASAGAAQPTPPAAAPEAPAAEPAPPAKDQTSALPAPPAAAPSIAGPALTANLAPDVTGSTTAQPTTAAALPPTQEPVQSVTNLGELPAGLGGAGVRKAALAGDARAVYEIASRAADGPGAGRDPKVALRLFERAAVAGLAPAQFRLGNMFEKGVGTPRDIALARVWYTRAAERGNAKAMHNLAVLYAEGVSGKPDYATATEWFRKAAELGVRDSQYNLAILLGRGLGAPADLGQSYLWFSVAAGQGDEDAGRKRDEVAQRMGPAELGSAKQAAESWRPKPMDSAANEVSPPARGWDETPSAAGKKPAKPVRG
jgi:localization factor PodJL